MFSSIRPELGHLDVCPKCLGWKHSSQSICGVCISHKRQEARMHKRRVAFKKWAAKKY